MRPERSRAAGIAPAPRGAARLRWLGPGVLWMVAAMGSGELLFTPRVAAQYRYALLWAFLAAVLLKWFVNREVGRWAVCTGRTALEGFASLRGPGRWAVWIIVLPQLVVAASAIAGFASSAATALVLLVPGPLWLWTLVPLAGSAALVLWGRYEKVELATKVFAVVLALAAISAAVSARPSPAALAAGLAPSFPPDVRFEEVLPWLGYALSGAVGLVWYSYWLVEKGYGAAGAQREVDLRSLDDEGRRSLRGWITQMTWDTTLAVVGAVVITLAFLVLGAELLAPRALVPEEREVARTLGTLLQPAWGRVGFWLMVGGVLVGFWGTLLSNQDGFGRLFANGTRLLAGGKLSPAWREEGRLQRAWVSGWLTVAPAALFLVVGEPVALLKLAGTIEAVHIPFVAGLVLYLNSTRLPAGLRPSWRSFVPTVVAVLFFLAFAAFYVAQRVTGGAAAP